MLIIFDLRFVWVLIIFHSYIVCVLTDVLATLKCQQTQRTKFARNKKNIKRPVQESSRLFKSCISISIIQAGPNCIWQRTNICYGNKTLQNTFPIDNTYFVGIIQFTPFGNLHVWQLFNNWKNNCSHYKDGWDYTIEITKDYRT